MCVCVCLFACGARAHHYARVYTRIYMRTRQKVKTTERVTLLMRARGEATTQQQRRLLTHTHYTLYIKINLHFLAETCVYCIVRVPARARGYETK